MATRPRLASTIVCSMIVLALVTVEPPQLAAQKGGTVVVIGWGGQYQEAQKKAIYTPFEKETGIRVVALSPIDYAKLKAMVQSGRVEWDVAEPEDQDLFRGMDEGLFEPLDFKVINTQGLDKEFVYSHGVKGILFSANIVYNTKAFPAGSGPKSWADLWDLRKFPGKRSLLKSATYTLEIALLADGVGPKNLYPLDVDRAFRSLDKIKPSVIWFQTPAQATQLVVDGQAEAGMAYNGRIFAVKQEGAPVELEWNQAIFASNTWAVPKGAKNKEAAMKFIAFALRPEIQAEMAKLLPYGPSNRNAFKFIPQTRARDLPTNPEYAARTISLDVNWWGKNLAKVEERFNDWLTK